jgi:pyruvate-ferredoxin/flavodoxin oxidoreductase
MDRFASLAGRPYRLFDYVGAPDAERVVVVMGSASGALEEAVEALHSRGGQRVGLLKVRLFRPFSAGHFARALPPTVRAIAVLDRTKEAGAGGEPLYKDVVTAIDQAIANGWAPFHTRPHVTGGRYGLGSKEFTPAMARAVFDELTEAAPRTAFTVGIDDDVTFSSLTCDTTFDLEPDDVVRAVLYGLGSDGTVGAAKNTIKIIGDETDRFAQGYFVYDSKKSGSTTVSHLRFGPKPIRSTYLIASAGFIACHQWGLLERVHVLERAAPGATFLLNSPHGPSEVWDRLPGGVRRQIVDKRLRLYVIDASGVAERAGMGRRVNTVLQTCFFALSGILPRVEAIAAIKRAVRKTYGGKGDAVVQQNFAATDEALAHLHEVAVPSSIEFVHRPPQLLDRAPEFVRTVIAPIMNNRGDDLPVSMFPTDGTYPVGTSRWEKRNLADAIPVWNGPLCIQCNKCALVCPHAAIRMKVYPPPAPGDAPPTFKLVDYKGAEYAGMKYTVQVAPEDCTGCELCVEVCPARDKVTGVLALEMRPQPPLRDTERANFSFFLELPDADRATAKRATVKGSQFLEPLFEFSGACAGCGETPYIKLATQLFGDRMVVANATGCSSIFGGNLPTTPWTCNADGRGPAWANSLFEDNAEFGYGMRITIDSHAEQARALVEALRDTIGEPLAAALLDARQDTEADIHDQRERVVALRRVLSAPQGRASAGGQAEAARRLLGLADYLVKQSVWIVGGDGWAYDIGYGGLDHVLASGRNVNVLVLDSEVYSNTGGQMSKATPRGAVAKFAAAGKPNAKKDLGLLAMTYGTVYVAQVAFGANDTQTVKAFLEAESFDGPSLIIAYSHCIAHGIEIRKGLQQQSRAVQCGHWPLYRFDPRAARKGEGPLTLDSRRPKIPFTEYAYEETRYSMLKTLDAATAQRMAEEAQRDVDFRWRLYEQLAALYRGAPAGAPVA